MKAQEQHPYDRSTMFTVLLDVDPAFPKMTTVAGARRITEALNAWYDNPTITDMHAFAKRWAAENPADR